MADRNEALDRMIAAVDDLMRTAGAVLVAQPHRMSEAAARLEAARDAMQTSLLKDGTAIDAALVQQVQAPVDGKPALPAGLRWLTDFEIRCVNMERFGCVVGSKEVRRAIEDAIALMKQPAPEGIPMTEDPAATRPVSNNPSLGG